MLELSDLLDSDTLECCEHMTDENTSEGDQSLDNLLLAAYDSISEPLEATLGDEHGREASERTTDSTPCACANAPNQPHPSPPGLLRSIPGTLREINNLVWTNQIV